MVPAPIVMARCVRQIRRLRRRVLGYSVPDWVTGLSTIAKIFWAPCRYLLAIELVPTFILLTFSPEHLLRHLEVIAKKKTIYKSPFSFLLEASGALAAALVFVLPLLGLGKSSIQIVEGMLLAAVLFSPFVIYLLLLLMLFSVTVPFYYFGVIPKIFFASSTLSEHIEKIKADLKCCLSPGTYACMKWRTFGYGLLMLDVYLFFAVGFLSIVAVAWLSTVGQVFDIARSPILFLPLGILGYFVIVRIYMKLLYASISVPPPGLIVHKVQELNKIIHGMKTKAATNVAMELCGRWASMKSDMRRFEASAGTDLPRYLANRSSAFKDVDIVGINRIIDRLRAMGKDNVALVRACNELERAASLDWTVSRATDVRILASTSSTSSSEAGNDDRFCHSCGADMEKQARKNGRTNQLERQVRHRNRWLILVVAFLLLAIVGVMVTDRRGKNYEQVRAQQENARKIQEEKDAERIRQLNHTWQAWVDAQVRADTIGGFIATLVRPGSPKQDPRARFLSRSDFPCAIVTRTLGRPDAIESRHVDHGMKTDLTYTISKNREAVFTCFKCEGSEGACGDDRTATLHSISMDGEYISEGMWSFYPP